VVPGFNLPRLSAIRRLPTPLVIEALRPRETLPRRSTEAASSGPTTGSSRSAPGTRARTAASCPSITSKQRRSSSTPPASTTSGRLPFGLRVSPGAPPSHGRYPLAGRHRLLHEPPPPFAKARTRRGCPMVQGRPRTRCSCPSGSRRTRGGEGLQPLDLHRTGLVFGRLRYRIEDRVGQPICAGLPEMKGHPYHSRGHLGGDPGPDLHLAPP